MELPLASEHRAKVGEFQRKHHTRLLALLFTDIVGSTDLKRELGDFPAVTIIQKHHAAVRKLLQSFPEGEEINTSGDSFFVVFSKPSDATKFALLLQSATRGSLAEDLGRRLLDRIGIHVGEVLVEEGGHSPGSTDFYGIQVNLCSRVAELAQGDQILLTRAAFDNARQILKGQDIEGITTLSWLNHGSYNLKGVEEAVEICEVGESGKAHLMAPPDSEKVRHHTQPDEELILGWRPALGMTIPHTHWILEENLGAGGFGEVWLGRHERLNEQRVFKFCFRADRARSLKREVTIFRLLKERVGPHPNIVGVQDVHFDQPPFYLVMDFSGGTDLPKWCEGQGGLEKVPLSTRIEIVAQVADALHGAHDAGVIHRDVKPSNIIINHPPTPHSSTQAAQPTAKLTDFGIGQVVSEEVLKGLTQAGFTSSVMQSGSPTSGTLLYMAPELFAGTPASAHSDVYSLGVVLFQLVAGDFSKPVTTDWGSEVHDPLLREDLQMCFAGNPQARFSNAGRLAANLRSLPKRRDALAQREAAKMLQEKAAKRRKSAWRLAVGACAVVAIIGLVMLRQTHKQYLELQALQKRQLQEESVRADAAQRRIRDAEKENVTTSKQLAEALKELNLLKNQSIAQQETTISLEPQHAAEPSQLDPDANAKYAIVTNTTPTALPTPTSPAIVAVQNQGKTSKEHQLMAIMLWRFCQFIDWPLDSFPDTTGPFTIGILGLDPFGNSLEAAVRGETVHNRQVAIQYLEKDSDLSKCQVLFISQSELEHFAAIASTLGTSHVLTASENTNFLSLGGMIGFFTVGNRVRFQISVEATARAGLKVDKRLLKLAEPGGGH